jgi:quercetin dioxygenase-like cupin family protein
MNPYNIQLDVKFNHQELIDVAPLIEQHQPWFNQTLTKVNNSVIRLGIVQGEFHWHKHDEDDEFFFVLSGKLFIDLEDKVLTLHPGQGATISKGILHRTRAEEKTVMLMVETSEIQPTGDEPENR